MADLNNRSGVVGSLVTFWLNKPIMLSCLATEGERVIFVPANWSRKFICLGCSHMYVRAAAGVSVAGPIATRCRQQRRSCDKNG